MILLLSVSPALAAPIAVGGRVDPPAKGARALLIPLFSEVEAAKLDLAGKSDPEPVASVAVAADGSFRLEAPEPGMYKVRVEAPGLVPREHPLQPLIEETELPAVELEKDARVEVRVTGADGRPMPGARVRIGPQSTPRSAWRVPVRAALVDAEGRAVLPRGPAEAVTVRAGAPGLPFGDGRSVAAYVEPLRPGESGPRILRLPAAETLSGRVISALDGRPVAGAVVWAGDPGAFQRTGGDGGYRLTAAAGRELGIRAAAAGYFEGGAGWPVRAGERRAPTLALEPALAAAGVVVDEQGRPVAGVEVEARIQPGSRIRTAAGWSSGGTGRTSASGKFRISNLAAGIAHQLKLTRAGFAPLVENVPPQAPGSELRLVLRRGRKGFGRVVDQAEKPVAGARVVLAREPSGDRIMRSFDDDGSGRFAATAGADGRFEISDLPAGTFQLTARGAGYAPITVPGLAVAQGAGSTDLGTVVLVRGVALEGYVTDPEGKPVEGARISVAEAGAEPTFGMAPADDPADAPPIVTAADGFFRVEDRRPGETLDVEARRAGYGPGNAPGVRVPSAEPLRIVLRPSSAVEGRTVDPDGKPVAGALVAINPAGPTALGRGYVMISTVTMRRPAPATTVPSASKTWRPASGISRPRPRATRTPT